MFITLNNWKKKIQDVFIKIKNAIRSAFTRAVEIVGPSIVTVLGTLMTVQAVAIQLASLPAIVLTWIIIGVFVTVLAIIFLLTRLLTLGYLFLKLIFFYVLVRPWFALQSATKFSALPNHQPA